MKIETDILNILENCRVDGNLVFIQSGQLDRKTYDAVNKVLTAIGGKWNRSAKAHVFSDDPAEMLDQAILTGGVEDQRKKFQFFETPRALANRMIDLAGVRGDDEVLEPSAGRGAIVRELISRFIDVGLDAVEINPLNIPALKESAGRRVLSSVHEADFLGIAPIAGYSRVIMNPPFMKQQDVDHITHARKMLKPGGRLVAICGEGAFFRQNAKSVAFRELVDGHGYSEKLPADSFRESGTGVNTRIVVLNS